MNFREKLAKRERSGVSEVVGALLLVLVVVVAVASFALYLSGAQKAAEQRQSYLNSVKNENLQVTSLSLFPNDPFTQWQFNLPSVPTNLFGHYNNTEALFYIHYFSQSYVGIFNGTDYNYAASNLAFDCPTGSANPCYSIFPVPTNGLNTTLWDQAPQTSLPGTPGYFNEISAGTPICVFNGNGESINPGTSMPFEPSIVINPDSTTMTKCTSSNVPPGQLSTIQPAAWDSANITVRNLNTQISVLKDVEFGGFFINKWTSPPQTFGFNATNSPETLEPASNTQVDFNMTSFNILKTASFSIVLQAADGNYFTSSFPIAAPFISSNIEAQNFGAVTEDVLDLSATPSTNSSISDYIWQVDIPQTTWTQGDWADSANLITTFVTGQSLGLSPNLIINNPLLSKALANGPFRVTATSVNQYGQLAPGNSLIIPENPDLAPASQMTVSQSGPCSGAPITLTVTVYNILHQPVQGVTVYLIPISGTTVISMSPLQTSSLGQAIFTLSSCTASNVVGISSPGINPITLTLG